MPERSPVGRWVSRGVMGLVPLLAACDPPCPSYWQAACKACGEGSAGCKHAREAAGRELGEAGKCASLTKSFEESEEFAKKRYCQTWVNEPRTLDDLRGPWICGGVEVGFEGPGSESYSSANPQKIVVSGAPSRIFNVRTATFQVEGKAMCHFHVGPHEMSVGEAAFAIRCQMAIGELPADRLVLCLRKEK